MSRRAYEAKFRYYLGLAEDEGLERVHSTALLRRQLYADLAGLYYQMYRDAPFEMTVRTK